MIVNRVFSCQRSFFLRITVFFANFLERRNERGATSEEKMLPWFPSERKKTASDNGYEFRPIRQC